MFSRLLHKTIFMLLAIATVSGCKKMDLRPVDRFTDENFWLVNGNVSNALNTCYQRIFNSQRFFYNEALSDNAYAQLDVNVGTPSAIASGNDGLFTPDLARILSDWGYYYNGIYACNLFLENVDVNQSIALNIKNRMKAEARFIRAFHYFRLMNWYGDVPLITKIEPDIDAVKNTARTPKAEILTFVLTELDAAITDLPKKEDYAGADKGRATKAAAKALKARVLLYQGTPATYAQVITICEDLMNNPATNGTYNTLQPTYSSVFALNNEQNAEIIFDLTYIGLNVRVYDEPSRFIPISAPAQNSENYNAPTQELVNSYVMANGKAITEAGSGYDENNPYTGRDPRFSATIVHDQAVWTNANSSTQIIYTKPGTDPNPSRLNEQGSGLHTPTGYYWKKYFDPASVSDNRSHINLILLRWSDVLLMYAEAKNALGQFNTTLWNLTIKPIRTRAGFTDALALNYPGNSTLTLTDVIRNERRSEFALESLRIDDIRRWKIAETVMNGWVHGGKWGPPAIDNGYIRVTERRWLPKHYLWPVPAIEIQKDAKLLPQNPGW